MKAYILFLALSHRLGSISSPTPSVSIKIISFDKILKENSIVNVEVRNTSASYLKYSMCIQAKNTTGRLGNVNPAPWYVIDDNIETKDDNENSVLARCQSIGIGQTKIIKYRLSDSDLKYLKKSNYSLHGKIILRFGFFKCGGGYSHFSDKFEIFSQ